jgi:hypothetical protein
MHPSVAGEFRQRQYSRHRRDISASFDVPARARASGAVTVLPKPTELGELLAAVDDVLMATPRERLIARQLKRPLLALRELAKRITPDERAQQRLRALIDRLQVAILAIDEQGRYVAASTGVSALVGCERSELLRMSIYDAAPSVDLPLARHWQAFLLDPTVFQDSFTSVATACSLLAIDGSCCGALRASIFVNQVEAFTSLDPLFGACVRPARDLRTCSVELLFLIRQIFEPLCKHLLGQTTPALDRPEDAGRAIRGIVAVASAKVDSGLLIRVQERLQCREPRGDDTEQLVQCPCP